VHTPGALHVPPFWHVGLHTAADANTQEMEACTREFMIVADLLHTMSLSSQ